MIIVFQQRRGFTGVDLDYPCSIRSVAIVGILLCVKKQMWPLSF